MHLTSGRQKILELTLVKSHHNTVKSCVKQYDSTTAHITSLSKVFIMYRIHITFVTGNIDIISLICDMASVCYIRLHFFNCHCYNQTWFCYFVNALLMYLVSSITINNHLLHNGNITKVTRLAHEIPCGTGGDNLDFEFVRVLLIHRTYVKLSSWAMLGGVVVQVSPCILVPGALDQFCWWYFSTPPST